MDVPRHPFEPPSPRSRGGSPGRREPRVERVPRDGAARGAPAAGSARRSWSGVRSDEERREPRRATTSGPRTLAHTRLRKAVRASRRRIGPGRPWPRVLVRRNARQLAAGVRLGRERRVRRHHVEVGTKKKTLLTDRLRAACTFMTWRRIRAARCRSRAPVASASWIDRRTPSARRASSSRSACSRWTCRSRGRAARAAGSACRRGPHERSAKSGACSSAARRSGGYARDRVLERRAKTPRGARLPARAVGPLAASRPRAPPRRTAVCVVTVAARSVVAAAPLRPRRRSSESGREGVATAAPTPPRHRGRAASSPSPRRFAPLQLPTPARSGGVGGPGPRTAAAVAAGDRGGGRPPRHSFSALGAAAGRPQALVAPLWRSSSEGLELAASPPAAPSGGPAVAEAGHPGGDIYNAGRGAGAGRPSIDAHDLALACARLDALQSRRAAADSNTLRVAHRKRRAFHH